MSYGAIIQNHRKTLALTQRQLAQLIGCSDSYIGHIETETKLPSLDICIALTQVFKLSSEEKQELLESVDNARRQLAEQRRRARQAPMGLQASQPMDFAGAPMGFATTTAQKTAPQDIDAEAIASDLVSDPDLQAAYEDLKTILTNPQTRETVLNVLKALAAQATQT